MSLKNMLCNRLVGNQIQKSGGYFTRKFGNKPCFNSYINGNSFFLAGCRKLGYFEKCRVDGYSENGISQMKINRFFFKVIGAPITEIFL